MSEPSFLHCLTMCANSPGFVKEFDRLTGHHLSELGKRSTLDALIDDATGRDREALNDFIQFVWEMVWARRPT